MDAAGKFKYAFVAFGPSIRGFSLMRKVIAVDGTFLKGKFNGTLLAACAQDGDYHLYPLAFAVVDAENGASWKWFFRGLRQMIPDASDLVFVSDRANSIASGLEDVLSLISPWNLQDPSAPQHHSYIFEDWSATSGGKRC